MNPYVEIITFRVVQAIIVVATDSTETNQVQVPSPSRADWKSKASTFTIGWIFVLFYLNTPQLCCGWDEKQKQLKTLERMRRVPDQRSETLSAEMSEHQICPNACSVGLPP